MHVVSDYYTYFRIIKDFQIVPFTQTEGWLRAFSHVNTVSVCYLVDHLDNPSIACFGYIRKLFGKKYLYIESECYRDPNIRSSQIKDFYSSISDSGFDVIEVNSVLPYSVEYEIGIRQAGYLRPVGLFSMYLTSVVDLTKDLSFNSNWKRNLKLAEESDLTFSLVDQPDLTDVVAFVTLYKKMTSDKSINHTLTDIQVKALLSTNNFGLATIKDHSDNLISAMIYHKSGLHAGLLFATKSDYVKNNGATFYMYKCLLESLREKGFSSFDMEKMVPSTRSVNGVFLFKQGIRGKYIICNGEWSWHKHSIYRPVMYFLKRFVQKKREV